MCYWPVVMLGPQTGHNAEKIAKIETSPCRYDEPGHTQLPSPS
jgi:hypothetical protein